MAKKAKGLAAPGPRGFTHENYAHQRRVAVCLGIGQAGVEAELRDTRVPSLATLKKRMVKYLRQDENGQIIPSAHAILTVERDCPHESLANKVRLARAETLLHLIRGPLPLEYQD